MAFVLIFLLGIANFAAHKAVLESGHPMIARIPLMRSRPFGDRFGPVSLILEFILLFATMLFLSEGYHAIAWVYALYSLFQKVGAVELSAALTALVIGGTLLLLSAFWHRTRATIVTGLPPALASRLPYLNRAAA